MRIGTFISILHLLIGLLGAGIITSFALYFIYISGEQASLRELEDLAFVAQNAAEAPLSAYQDGTGTLAALETTLADYLKARPEVRYTILSPDGRIFLPDAETCTRNGISLSSPEVQAALQKTIGHSIRTCAPTNQRMFYVAAAIYSGPAPSGILVLAAPYNALMQPTFKTMRGLGVVALLIVLFTVAEGWLGSIYISRPLERLSKVAARLREGDLSARAELRGPVEVVHLASTLNGMAEQVQANFDSMRGFVANASHELRTPLTTLKLQVGALDNASDDPEVSRHFLRQVDSEIDRMNHLVSDMLDLSRIEARGAAIERQPVDLGELSSEVLAFWEARSRQAGVSLTLDNQEEPGGLVVSGDPYRLRQLMDNLVDNAIKYTAAGGSVTILLRRCPPEPGARAAEMARIEVRDTGVGIAAEHLPRIFDRFYRVEMRRVAKGSSAPGEKTPGSGLGLAIARSIVTTHDGEIGVTSQPGMGSTFWVELPAA